MPPALGPAATLAALLLCLASDSAAAAAAKQHTFDLPVVFPEHPVAERDAYLCTSLELPDRPLKLVGVHPTSDQRIVHHMLLFGARLPRSFFDRVCAAALHGSLALLVFRPCSQQDRSQLRPTAARPPSPAAQAARCRHRRRACGPARWSPPAAATARVCSTAGARTRPPWRCRPAPASPSARAPASARSSCRCCCLAVVCAGRRGACLRAAAALHAPQHNTIHAPLARTQQMHYLDGRPANDTSGLTLRLTDAPVPFSTGMAAFAANFAIPPGKASTLVPNACCYSGWEPLRAFATRVHTHALGRCGARARSLEAEGAGAGSLGRRRAATPPRRLQPSLHAPALPPPPLLLAAPSPCARSPSAAPAPACRQVYLERGAPGGAEQERTVSVDPQKPQVHACAAHSTAFLACCGAGRACCAMHPCRCGRALPALQRHAPAMRTHARFSLYPLVLQGFYPVEPMATILPGDRLEMTCNFDSTGQASAGSAVHAVHAVCMLRCAAVLLPLHRTLRAAAAPAAAAA